MKTLEKLLLMDDKAVQAWLVRVDVNKEIKTLITALAGAGNDIKNRVFSNMSQRASAALKDGINGLPYKHTPAEMDSAAENLEKLM